MSTCHWSVGYPPGNDHISPTVHRYFWVGWVSELPVNGEMMWLLPGEAPSCASEHLDKDPDVVLELFANGWVTCRGHEYYQPKQCTKYESFEIAIHLPCSISQNGKFLEISWPLTPLIPVGPHACCHWPARAQTVITAFHVIRSGATFLAKVLTFGCFQK